MTGFPTSWDPTTCYGMPPEYMISSAAGQASSLASQPMIQQVNVSAPQLTQSQDTAPAPQPAVPTASAPTLIGPNNVSASGLTPHQQNLAMQIQPKSPTEVLVSRFPHANGITWIFHDHATSYVRHVNVPTYILWHINKLIKGQRRPVMAMRWSFISHSLVRTLSMSHRQHQLLSRWLHPVRSQHRQTCR
jgi:hypothetical protein